MRMTGKLPFKTRLVHRIAAENTIKAEKSLHQRYHHRHLNGEWFSKDLKAMATFFA